jgi:hypothetical protein
MELENIKTQTTWSDAAESINSNNLKIVTEVTKLQSATYKNKGYFKTFSDLQSAFPTAMVGSKAYVGLSYPYTIYLWQNNAWVNSGTGGDESITMDQFYTKDETDSQISALEKATDAKLTELSEEVSEVSERTNSIEFETNAPNEDSITIQMNDGNEVGKIIAEKSESEEGQRWESNDGNEVYASISKDGLKAKTTIDIPSIVIPQVYEPTDVDSEYSSPIGRNNVKRADWASEQKVTYYSFLAKYYDTYLGNIEGGYSVRKRSLGSDSSKSGYELFEYDFKPLNYRKVVMISAGMNACETGAIWGLATFAKALMTSEEEGFKFLRENVRFKILPFICPSSFDQDTLAYPNSNGVRINKNFNWNRSWYNVADSTKGEYPDSEAETRILKAWINENAWKADLYIDCHQDPDKNASQANDLTIVICSDTQTRLKVEKCFPSLVEFYSNKGYIGSNVTPNTSAWVEPGTAYPKTRYAMDVCGIPSIMIEQYCSSTMYGSDGNTINDTYGIKNYVLMLRLYTFSILAKGTESIKGADLSTISLIVK